MTRTILGDHWFQCISKFFPRIISFHKDPMDMVFHIPPHVLAKQKVFVHSLSNFTDNSTFSKLYGSNCDGVGCTLHHEAKRRKKICHHIFGVVLEKNEICFEIIAQ